MSQKKRKPRGTSPRAARKPRRRISGEIVIILALILAVGLAGGLWTFVLQPSVVSQWQMPGSVEPTIPPLTEAVDFGLPDLAGNTVRLSDYQGQPVVLNTWATWCAPCRLEMPDLDKLYQEYKDQGVVVLAVNIGESRDTVAGFIEEAGYTFPVLLDESASVVVQPYRISSIPATFFIDGEGRVASIRVGAMSLDEMKQRLAEIL